MIYVSTKLLLKPPVIFAILAVFVSQTLAALSLAQAHELWLEQAEPMISEDNQIEVDIRLGQMFSGSKQFFIPERSVTLKLITGEGEVPLNPRPGNRPAISIPAADQPGHMVIAYETIGFYLTYTEWEKFVAFTETKRASAIPDQHFMRKLSKDNFKERYKRFAKTSLFIPKTNESINDAATGLEIEFIITNVEPVSEIAQRITAVLIYQDNPLANAPVTLFIRTPDSQVMTKDLKTDDQGLITLEAQTGAYYMLDHVLFRPIAPDADPKGAVWETLWASHSFLALPHPR